MDWLVRLHDQGLSGILAGKRLPWIYKVHLTFLIPPFPFPPSPPLSLDEMGLGKTVQTIALLAHLACAEGIWGPHLIIVPTSVLSNWEREFQRFAPGFHVLSYHGSARERKEKRRGWQKGTEGWAHIVITSYSLAIQDSAILRRRRWYYLILDEGHSIKNARSLRWQTLLTYPSARRLILTGTPLQNNLEELWALLYFLMPPGLLDHGGGFANAREFQEWFSQPVHQRILQEGLGGRSSLPVPEDGTENLDSEDGEHAVARLHALLRPYLLRRLKDEVEGEMPGKHEVILWCDLSQRQRRLYDDYMSRAQTREMLLGEGSERPKGSYIGVMNCMMQLRKVCNHPDLFQERGIDTPFAMSSEVQEEGSRVEWLVRRMLHDLKEPVDRPDFAWWDTSDYAGKIGWTLGREKGSSISFHWVDRCDPLGLTKKPNSPTVSKVMGKDERLWDLGHSLWMDQASYWKRRQDRLCMSRYRAWMSALRSRNGLDHGLDQGCSMESLIQGPLLLSSRVSKGADLTSGSWLREVQTTRLSKALHTVKGYVFLTTPAITFPISSSSFPLPFKHSMTSSTPTSPIPSTTPLPPFSAYGDAYWVIRDAQEIAARQLTSFPDRWALQYDCGKLQRLALLLRDLRAGGHRPLIFTQMTRMLDILEAFLNLYGLRYLRLDGSTKVEDRLGRTERFNQDSSIFAFILSTRSGGVGINLTGADTVIFYDSDWNPFMDRQCQDRCHRIGQTREVTIYRLISDHTIEVNILRAAEEKRQLDRVVLEEGDFTTGVWPTGLVEPKHESRDKGKIWEAMAEVEEEEDRVALSKAEAEERAGEREIRWEEGSAFGSGEDIVRSGSESLRDGKEGGGGEGKIKQEEGERREEEERMNGERMGEEGEGSVDEYMVRMALWRRMTS